MLRCRFNRTPPGLKECEIVLLFNTSLIERETIMTFRQITVLSPVQTMHGLELDNQGFVMEVASQQYFRCKLSTDDFGDITTTIWEHNQLDLFHLFIEFSINILNNNGLNSFIISN